MPRAVRTKSPESIRQRLTLDTEQTELEASRGSLVRYEMPTLPQPFTRLADVLSHPSYRRRWIGTEYFADYGQRLQQIIPAVEYHKFVFRAAAEKLDALRHGLARIAELERSIAEQHHETRTVIPVTQQPSITLRSDVYALKSELASALFVTSSLLETLVTLMPVLYGADSDPFRSFARYVRNIRGARQDRIIDYDMLAYLNSEMEWWDMLNNYRDYVTHFGAIEVKFYESPPRRLHDVPPERPTA